MNANFIYQVTDKDELSAAVSAYLLGFDGLLNSVHSAYTMQLLDIEDACEYVPLYGEDIWEHLYKYDRGLIPRATASVMTLDKSARALSLTPFQSL